MTKEEREYREEKAVKTFCIVRDALKKSGNAWACNACFHTPWKFYKTHTTEECVKLLLEKYTCPNCGAKMDGKDGESNA